jgi:hypothetical protein
LWHECTFGSLNLKVEASADLTKHRPRDFNMHLYPLCVNVILVYSLEHVQKFALRTNTSTAFITHIQVIHTKKKTVY